MVYVCLYVCLSVSFSLSLSARVTARAAVIPVPALVRRQILTASSLSPSISFSLARSLSSLRGASRLVRSAALAGRTDGGSSARRFTHVCCASAGRGFAILLSSPFSPVAAVIKIVVVVVVLDATLISLSRRFRLSPLLPRMTFSSTCSRRASARSLICLPLIPVHRNVKCSGTWQDPLFDRRNSSIDSQNLTVIDAMYHLPRAHCIFAF